MADWFTSRTFAASAFDIDALSGAKRTAGLSVSVVLPALDERETIGGVIDAVTPLMGTLVDELVVIDSASTDGTAVIAAAHGARVVGAAEIAPELGPVLGKGDALWRSLGATTGDIIAWIDADIRNPSPDFVVGLLGPLLTVPEVGYVKGFYERPLQVGDVLHPVGGGRVTELTARPLLNLFWPELAGLVQPLSGEYAGRRTLLESVPFFTGYGVELGLLVDLLARLGPTGIAQVDLQLRIHRHQSLDALSRMAFGVGQVAARRLCQSGRLALPAEPDPTYLQFVREGGTVRPRSVDMPVVERPAFADYRAGGALPT